MAGALIVTAELGQADFVWLDRLRRRHYPPERNQVPAHLTLFRSLPPSVEAEVREAIRRACASPPPRAIVIGVMDLGGGVAIRIRSPDLDDLRDELGQAFHGLLTPQDGSGWIPHVTIQNKVDRPEPRRLVRKLQATVEERPLAIRGLALFRYLDGPWEPVASCRFRGA